MFNETIVQNKNVNTYKYICTMPRFQKDHPQYVEDPILRSVLEEVGFDLEKLHKMYKMTPVDRRYVYIDFLKYVTDVEWKMDADTMLKAKNYLFKWKREMNYVPKVLTLDEALLFIDRPKSSTFPLNQHYKNKGECLDDIEFRKSFVKFMYGYYTDQYLPLWCATQKEEIRSAEKVDQGKVRSFMIGPLYLLIMSHMVNYDLDMATAKDWKKLNIGMGMSLFHGDYNDKFESIKDWLFAFSDVSKWDSRMQYILAAIECDVNCAIYGPNRKMFLSKLLGSWDKYRVELGLPDLLINLDRLRHKITYDSFYSYVVLPNGEIVLKLRGQPSGDARTTPRNTAVHKLMTFLVAVRKMLTYQETRHNIKDDETGDDMFNAIRPGFRLKLEEWMEAYVKTLGEFAWEVETSGEVGGLDTVEYLSTRPVFFDCQLGQKIVPIVNSSKVVASLADKTKTTGPAMALTKLCAARLLTFFEQETFSKLDLAADKLIARHDRAFDTEFQNAKKSKFSAEEIASMYVGRFESISEQGCEMLFSFLEEHMPGVLLNPSQALRDVSGGSLNHLA